MGRNWTYHASKSDVLDYIHQRQVVTASDLVERFNYAPSGARRRLQLLKMEKLIESLEIGEYALTEMGFRRLDYLARL